MEVFNLGQMVRIAAVFTDLDDVETDPTAVFVVIKAPGSAAVTYTYGMDDEVVKDSTGNYHIDQALTSTGIWVARWYSTGTVQAGSQDERIRVRETVCD